MWTAIKTEMKDYLPYNYQRAAYQHVMDNPKCGLFLDMGLGKTVITLTAICDLLLKEEVKNVLIIAPLRVANSVWKQEAAKWMHTSWIKVSVCTGSQKQRIQALNTDAQIYVINRENTKWLCDYYNYFMPFDMLVIDELSSFKSFASQRFKCIKRTRHQFKRIVGLTGTPSSNGYMDLWSEIFTLDGGERLGKFITQYRNRYFIERRVGASEYAMGYDLREGADVEINEKIADICLSMKTEDYLELPKFNVVDEEVELPENVYNEYRQFERDRVIDTMSQELTATNSASLTNKLLQFANGAVYYETMEDDRVEKKYVSIHSEKIERLLSLIEKADGKPVLVAYSFRHDLERITEAISIAFPSLTLRVLKDDNDVTDWNEGKINVMIAHPASAGHGLNLQFGGNILIWFGLTWSLELYLQFNKRLHRQGIEKPVTCYRIIAKDTYDEVVAAALQEKTEVQDGLMEFIKRYKYV